MGTIKITRSVLGTITVFLALTAAMPIAEAGQRAHRHYRSVDPGYAQDRGYGWRGLRLFGFGYGERCDELLRKAIRIDTPDPRYWNAYDACIGL